MHSSLAGFFDVRLPHLGLGAVAPPVPAECLRSDVVAGSKAPKREGRRSPLRWGVPRAVPQMQPLQVCTPRQPPQCLWPKQHPQLRALGAAARDGVLHPTKVTITRALALAASGFLHRGYLQVHNLLRPWTFVRRRPRQSACHLVFRPPCLGCRQLAFPFWPS